MFFTEHVSIDCAYLDQHDQNLENGFSFCTMYSTYNFALGVIFFHIKLQIGFPEIFFSSS